MASRRAYFRSSLTPNACLWAFSSRFSSRLAPSTGARQSLCSSAAQALSVSLSFRSRISAQSKAERAVVGPFVAVEQQPVVQAHQQHVSRGAFSAEHGLRQHVGPGFALQRLGHRLAVVMARLELVVRQVLRLGARLVGGDDGEPRQLQMPHRHRQPGDEFVPDGEVGWRGAAQGLQQAGLDLGVGLPALGIVARALDLAPQTEPALAPSLQSPVRCTVGFVAGMFGFGRVPGIQPSLDVTLEDLGKVVVAVELVLVGDTREGLDGVDYGHVRLRRRQWRLWGDTGPPAPGSRAVVRWSGCRAPTADNRQRRD